MPESIYKYFTQNKSNNFSIFQYCEYYPDYEKCKAWLEKNLPDEFSKVKIGDAAGDDAAGDDEKKRQKRGGKGMMKAKKTKEDGPKKICVSRAPRGKKKSVTVVTGLSTFGKLNSCRCSFIILLMISHLNV